MSEQKTMRLITSAWQAQKTFRLIPVSIDCPFVEGIFDPESKTMVLFAKTTRDNLHMIPKVDDNGDLQKVVKGRPNGKTYKEERKFTSDFMEYIFMEKEEIKDFIKSICINSDSYDYAAYVDAVPSLMAGPEQKIEMIK